MPQQKQKLATMQQHNRLGGHRTKDQDTQQQRNRLGGHKTRDQDTRQQGNKLGGQNSNGADGKKLGHLSTGSMGCRSTVCNVAQLTTCVLDAQPSRRVREWPCTRHGSTGRGGNHQQGLPGQEGHHQDSKGYDHTQHQQHQVGHKHRHRHLHRQVGLGYNGLKGSKQSGKMLS